MPSKNMLPKGKRRQSVMKDYRELRSQIQDQAKARAESGEISEETEATYDTADLMRVQVFESNSPFAHVPGLVTSGPNGGKHPQEEHTLAKPRYDRPKLAAAPAPEIQVIEDLQPENGVRKLTAEPAAAGMRIDAYLAKVVPDISRARVVLLIDEGQVTIDGKAVKASLKLKGGEAIEIEGEPRLAPLNATPEDIALDVVYEDDDMAVINKPAGMMVHAGSGSAEHNSGTLVNALLYRFGGNLSSGSQPVAEDEDVEADTDLEVEDEATPSTLLSPPSAPGLRPGIVHRLDKQTSGLIVVAKNDVMHRKLSEMFASRNLRKVYLALVHGELAEDEGTVQLPISRDLVRRIRMTTKRSGGRSAVSHWRVLDRLDTAYGKFTLVEVHIETGRTHQIRVHMQAIGHPVVGDFLYGAPHRIPLLAKAGKKSSDDSRTLELERNFLHAAELDLAHPRTGKELELRSELPAELTSFLDKLRQP
jgi:23S rRNA pseudouridine1911/1915/1917 synthase